MGYIKKLKNNELVGGTDKTTIYPVTSTKAVFEEVTDGDKSSFKSQETINKEQRDTLDEHAGRLNTAETEDIKGITINHSETVHTVEEGTNIVNLTIYTAETADDQAIAGLVEQNYNNIILNADAIAAEKNRAEDIEEGLQDQITDLDNGKQVKLSVGPGITLTEDGLISATADPAIGKVVETRPTTDIIEGMIYLVQTSTPGTYKQWVYDGSSWADKGNVSLSITADDAIDSTSTNPIQNDAITAQIGYFVCGDSNGSSATKNVDAPSYSPSDVGGAFKIKMNYVNTSTDTVYLRFNSDNTTKKELRYNREPVTPDNSWEENEVISVYYDGTYYQASNAQGGGASGKKTINPSKGVYGTGNVATQGAIPVNPDTSGNNATWYRCAKYPVNEGDVLLISGAGSGYDGGKLWAFGDSSGNYMYGSETSGTQTTVLLTAPEGAKWVVLNSKASADIAWYCAKKDSVGAHEILTEAYLYGDIRTLEEGQNYDKDEAVKTSANQFVRVTKEIKALSLSEALANGDLRTDDNATYRAAGAISIYNPNTTYSASDYALGSMTVYTLTVTAESITAGNITVNGTEVAIEATDDADAIATKISSALNIEGWTDSASGNVITVRCNTIGNNTTTITITDTDSTGVVVSGISTPSETGTSVIRKYDGENWEDVSPSVMKTDGILELTDEAWLITNATEQNSVQKDIEHSQKELAEAINWGTIGIYYESNSTIPGTSGTSCSLGGSGKWINTNGSRHIVIACTEGDIFNLTADNGNYYGFLASYSTPSPNQTIQYAPGEGRHWFNRGNGQLVIPSGTAYLCLCTKDGAAANPNTTWTITSQIKTPLKEVIDSMASESDLQTAVQEAINESVASYLYYPSSYIPINETSELYGTTHSTQGSAFYGDYLVSLRNNVDTVSPIENKMCIYNVRNKSVVADNVLFPDFPNTNTHYNTMSFSGTKYDNGDLLPLLYICSGYAYPSGSSTTQVYVVRIVNTNDVYSTELVQTITIDFGRVGDWTEFVVDSDKGRAWIKSGGTGFTYICIALPSTSSSEVTIDSSTTVIDSFNVKRPYHGLSNTTSQQGMYFYHGRIYQPWGVPQNQGEDSVYITVDNTLTHCREAVVSLKNYGLSSYEPESCFIWEGNIYVVMNGGRIYKLTQS